ncbi:precorrin-4 C(11)-methyltransferase [Allosaccharopolyspora coralli]|uniref:Precorrin-4 C(11)-methyltransferase n=1 Tax=Allosaccharopolyspora coralli TaxID=2665642 RepID=A0A5Q3QCL0_9PSEU|nr:cobalt-precorrin-4/precorrin-4 C(11)-methyltransferase [Allosaccharopolyspora coralli]QGK70974.1 precorrin-4 C(11)-methyltransferase [Allosaccharopolyspora coralli]
MSPEPSRARVSFVGAGPGAGDLITVRGARRLAEADVILWAASVVAPDCLHEHAARSAELVDSSKLTHDDSVEVFRRAERDRLRVVRVHAGDPSLWGGVQAQYDACARMDVDVEIVPGVAELSAAAAAVGRELTDPEYAQSVVLCRPEVSASREIREFAAHGTTMSVLLPASRAPQLAADLKAGGYQEDVPVLVAAKVSSPDEVVLRTTLGELERSVRQHKLWRQALFVVGGAVSGNRARTTRSRQAAGSTTPRGSRPRSTSSTQRAVARTHGEPFAREYGPYRPNWAQASEASTTEPERAPASGVPNPDLAWWTVRDWQETARGAARAARTRRVDQAQPHLFVGSEPASPELTEPAVPEQSTSEPEPIETAASAENDEQSPPAGATAKAPQAKSSSKAASKSQGPKTKRAGSSSSRSAKSGQRTTKRTKAQRSE